MTNALKVLRPYQEQAVLRFIDCDSAFWDMEMRLGKTLTAIRWARRSTLSPRKILVVAPKTVLLSWEKELEEEGERYVSLVDYRVKERHAYMAEPYEMFSLANYETISKLTLDKDCTWRLLLNFDLVILDESICIKNAGSKAAKVLLKASPHLKMRACLCGLVNPESWLEVWTQIAFANGGEWMGFDNFYAWRECYASNFGYSWEISAKNQAAIKKEFHDSVFSLKRKDAGIRDIKIRQRREGTMGAYERRIYDSVETSWELPGEGIRDEPNEAKFKLVVSSWLRRITGGVLPTSPLSYIPTWKLDETVEIVTKELPGESIVIWFAFNAELALVYAALKKAGVTVTWIVGASTQEERRDRIAAFQAKKVRVILVQQKCGQYGIDLAAADTAIYYSYDPSYNLRAQSEERIFKVGKPNDLLIIDLITKDTCDEEISALVKDKKLNSNLLFARLVPPREVAKRFAAG